MYSLGTVIFVGIILYLTGMFTVISVELILIDLSMMKGKRKEDPDKEEWKGLP